jgi:acetoin utilization deacetylase AcuC-like enzyme
MTIALISHPDCTLHDMGEGHPEQPARVQVIQSALEHYQFHEPVHFYQSTLATRDQLVLAHDPDYVDYLFKIAPQTGVVALDPDTWMNTHTLRAALLAAGSGVMAVDLVMSNQARVAFCNVRPPGHHAEVATAMGFCFFNNIAVAVRHALSTYQLERIAIIDFDVHHGNGTQAIFQNDERVMLCSSFQHPFYPGYQSAMDNQHILTLPLPAGTDGESYRRAVAAAWFAKLADFQPQLVFFSAGFDAHQHDPLAQLNLTVDDYHWITREVMALTRASAMGKAISMLEGGYDLAALATCVPVHVAAMAAT